MLPKERQQLAEFFEKGMQAGCFAYTIFGDKPVSLYVHKGVDVASIKELWKICAEEFKIKNFILKFQPTDHPRYHFVYLINIKSVCKTIDAHKTIFPDDLLTKILNDRITFEEALNHNEGLKGLLLGFGDKSSFQFQRRAELMKEIEQFLTPPYAFDQTLFSESDLQMIVRCKNEFYKNFTTSEATPNAPTKLLELLEEYHALQDTLEQDEPLSPFPLPTFVRNESDPEVQSLMKQYKTCREQIIQVFSGRDHLEVILCKMAQ